MPPEIARRSINMPRPEINSAQTGGGLIMVIFLLVILGALAGYAFSLFATQTMAHSLDERGTRAYLSARAAVEAGAYLALQDPSGLDGLCNGYAIASYLPTLSNLSDYSAKLTCSVYLTQQATSIVSVYHLIGTGGIYPAVIGTSPSPVSVERQLEVTLVP